MNSADDACLEDPSSGTLRYADKQKIGKPNSLNDGSTIR